MFGLIARVLSLFLFLLATHCNWVAQPDKQTLVVGLSDEAKTLDPRWSTDATGLRIGQLIYSTLIRWDPVKGILPDLAQSWSTKPKQIRFELRPRIAFQDGSPLLPQDIKQSIESYRQESSPFSSQFTNIVDVKVDYDFKQGGSVEITLKRDESAIWPDLAMIKIFRPQSGATNPDPAMQIPLATGPYRLNMKNSQTVRLIKNPHYYAEPGRMEKIEFKLVHDPTTRFLKLYKGEIDLIQGDMPISKINFFRDKKEKFHVLEAPSLDVTYILLNLKKEPMSQTSFRQALAASLNIDDILKYRFQGSATRSLSLLPTSLSDSHPSLTTPRLSDEKIRTIFAQVENPILIKSSNNFDAIENVKHVSSQWEKYGLKTQLQSSEWGHFYHQIQTGNFSIALMKWVGISHPSFLRTTLHSSMTPPGRNRGFYNSPSFDQIVDQAQHTSNPEKAHELYLAAQEILHKDLPIIPLWSQKQIAILQKNVKGFELLPRGDFHSFLKVYKEQ